MRRMWLAIVCVSIAGNAVFAQDATLTASVDQNKVGVGDQFQVTFLLAGGNVNGASNFRAPNFGQLLVVSGPNTSQSFQIINGSMSGSVTYTYVLYARQTGKYTIDAASVDCGGKTIKSQPIQIEVVQGKPKPQQAQTGGVDASSIGDNVIIKATADKQRIRVGEQLTVTYKLYTRVSISGYDLEKAPTFEGFWSEDFDQPKEPSLGTETINGKQYRVATLKRTALFATQSGNLKIAPIEVRCAVQVQSRRRSTDPFDSFFNDPFFQQMQTVNVDFKSNPLTIDVEPIPANAPAGYTGAIGRYSFAASIDKNSVQTGDPITLRLSVTGTGNIKLIALPKPELPADVEAYEPKITEDISRDAGVIKGKKTAEYLMIPRNAGSRVIEPMSFVYFDLERGQYVSLHSPKFELAITPGKETAARTNLASKEEIKLLGEDIRFLKLSIGSLEGEGESPFGTGWFAASMSVPPLLFIGAFAYRKRLEKIYGDMPRLLFERAGKEASLRLKQAKQLLARGNTEQYHAEVSRALLGYLEHKLRLSRASLSLEDAVMRLREGGVADEAVQKFRQCVERAEFARFAPGADSQTARKGLLDAAAAAISLIERSYAQRGRKS